MRLAPALLTILAAAAACGTDTLEAPPPLELPSELSVTVVTNPDARGGLRSSTIVSSMVVDPFGGRGVLKTAEYTVRDAQGNVLAREAMATPLPFAGSVTVTFQRTLAWTPADVLGRTVHLHYVVDAGTASVYDYSHTFEF
jgi:hypothetical protein